MPLFVLYFSGNQNQQQQGGYQNNQQGWSKYQLLDKGMRETRLNCDCLYFIRTNDSFLFNTLMPLLNTWKLIAEMAKDCTFFYLSKFFLFFFLPVKKFLVFCLDQLVFTSHCLMTGVFHINCSKGQFHRWMWKGSFFLCIQWHLETFHPTSLFVHL